jgi:hypothetical protein
MAIIIPSWCFFIALLFSLLFLFSSNDRPNLSLFTHCVPDSVKDKGGKRSFRNCERDYLASIFIFYEPQWRSRTFQTTDIDWQTPAFSLSFSEHETLGIWLSYGMLRSVVWFKFTDVSEVPAASNIRAMSAHCPDDGGSKHLWNVGKLLPDCKAQHPRRQSSLYSPPWELEISHETLVYFEHKKSYTK